MTFLFKKVSEVKEFLYSDPAQCTKRTHVRLNSSERIEGDLFGIVHNTSVISVERPFLSLPILNQNY